MYSPAIARPRLTSTPHHGAPRSLGLRTQMMARGPGWRLAEGEGGIWTIKITKEARDAVLTWAHILRTLNDIGQSHGLRPLVLDLRDAQRVCGPVVEAAGLVFELFESHGLRVAALVGHDVVQAARMHRLMTHHATTWGRCFMDEDDCDEWTRPWAHRQVALSDLRV